MSVRETPIRSALFEWKIAVVFPPRMFFATRTFLQMWKGKLSVLQLKNFIRTLHEFDDAHVLLIILMAKCLSEFRRSDNDSMRMGFFKMKKGDKKVNSGKVEFRCDVTMPRSSLEEGALLSEILDLFEDILHGRRSDADAVREFLKKRAKLFD